jgi:lipopolysaccharide export system ATP-binding protein
VQGLRETYHRAGRQRQRQRGRDRWLAGPQWRRQDHHVRHDREEVEQTADRLLEEFGLAPIQERASYLLSGGERRRCEIARAMAISPRFILLDEPFAGIDPIAVAEIQGLVKRLATRRIGVLITDHNVRETLQITDRAYIIASGRIFRSGSPSELADDNEVRRIYLGADFRLH